MQREKELLLADTSYVSASNRAVGRAEEAVAAWPRELLSRIDLARLAISVVTVAEVRLGHRVARWGERRRRHAERWLKQFTQLPVDESVADSWAELTAAARRRGRAFGANDLWIAATGRMLGVPVVTCDRAFLHMESLGVRVIYLPARADAGVAVVS